MTLARPRRAEDYHIGPPLSHESQGHDRGFGSSGNRVKVEVLKGFSWKKRARPSGGVSCALLQARSARLRAAGPRAKIRPFGEPLPHLPDRRQPKFAEHEVKVGFSDLQAFSLGSYSFCPPVSNKKLSRLWTHSGHRPRFHREP